MKPIRIQRRRTKDWRMPENTVYVGRGTEWGNPFVVGKTFLDKVLTPELAVTLYQMQVEAEMPPLQNVKRSLWKLLGKNLACWCDVGQICHADVLLKLANEGNL